MYFYYQYSSFFDISPIDTINAITDTFEFIYLFLFIVLGSTVSAIFFSYASLKIRHSSDTLSWFFVPAFTAVFVAIFENRNLTQYEYAALAFIISSNILVVFRADGRVAYLGSIIALLCTGLFCSLVNGQDLPYYFDALGVLAIFFVVILAFLLEKISTRADRESDLFQNLWVAASRQWHEFPDELIKFQNKLLQFQETKKLILMRRKYRQLLNYVSEDEVEIVQTLNSLMLSRLRGARFADIFALTGVVFASVVIGLFGRGNDWGYDIFVTLYIPSMVFAMLSLMDLQLDRNRQNFRMPKSNDLLRGKLLVRIRSSYMKSGDVIWSVILICFVVGVFTASYLSYSGLN